MTGPSSGTGYPSNPNVHRYPPIVRAAPINSNQEVPVSPTAGGYGDLGVQNFGGPTTRPSPTGERLATDRHSSMSSPSSTPSTARINAITMRPDPAGPALQRTRSPPPTHLAVINSHRAAPRPMSSPLSSPRTTSHAPSAVNGRPGPGPGFRVDVTAHSSLV